jgi:hypothetical protein
VSTGKRSSEDRIVIAGSRKWGAAVVLVLSGWVLLSRAATHAWQQAPEERFLAVDVFVDSGDEPLAAWQVELADPTGVARVVGVEGGEHPAFREAPYYDPAALQKGRIVLATFHVGGDLPRGRTRVARVHLLSQVGEPTLEVAPMAAATQGGRRIDVRVELQR